jgi:hypothetical protein
MRSDLFTSQVKSQATSQATSSRWWGSFQIAHERAGCWRIGSMELWIQRLRGEWLIARKTDESAEEDRLSVDMNAAVVDLLELEAVSRFGVSSESEDMILTPLLADRSVITSPVKPFYIPAGETLTVYVGSPLWVRVEVGSPPLALAEFPIVRPSDTWFGSSTYRGELCYASRTACRLRLDDLPVHPHRAVTAVEIKNRASAALLLERMKLPVGYLSLFQDDQQTFWTRDLSIVHDEGEGRNPIHHGADVPTHAGKAVLVSRPRHRSGDNLAMRVFSSLFR